MSLPGPTGESRIYDWNRAGDPRPAKAGRLLLNDETLRDGLQSPSVSTPPIESKLRILHLMDALGIDCVDIGLPGAGPHVARDVERLAREIVDQKLGVRPNCAARTVVADIEPIVEISQRVGRPVEVAAFIGSSPVRQYVEDWSTDFLVRCTDEAVSFAVREGLPVTYVTEDTTRAHPDTLRRLYVAAIRAGATRLCIADTVGHATPAGAAALVRFIGQVIDEEGGGAAIDWHGHRDRDMAIVNTISAIDAGASRVHATALGVGERAGNTPMDLLLVNLVLLGYLERDLTGLREYCDTVSDAFGVPIPVGYPVFGRDAFRTATGVHAAAVVKAFRKGDQALADTVYSSVPARLVGREQEIDVGPMSGRSNVVFWLERHGITPADAVVDRVFRHAKASTHVLSDEEIRAIVKRDAGGRRGPEEARDAGRG
jgi:2-isopropylmalate synthase